MADVDVTPTVEDVTQAVHDLVAEAIDDHNWLTEEQCRCGWETPTGRTLGSSMSEWQEESCAEQPRNHQAAAVVAAVRAMTPEALAELIRDGYVDRQRWYPAYVHPRAGTLRSRGVGPWVADVYAADPS